MKNFKKFAFCLTMFIGLQSIFLDARFDNQYKYLLRSFGSGPNIANDEGQTFLHDAVIDNDLDEVRDLLMDPAIEVNAQDNYGNSPLYIAVVNNNKNIILALLAHQAQVNIVNNQDRTPLDIAIIYGCNDIIPVLMKAGAEIHRLNKHGIAPLHIAAINNNVGAILLLLDAGVQIDIQDRYRGETPLHFAVLNNAIDAVRILLNAGADTTIMNKDGKTAEQLAIGNLQIGLTFTFAKMPGVKNILEMRKKERNSNHQMRQLFGNYRTRSMSPELLQGPLVE